MLRDKTKFGERLNKENYIDEYIKVLIFAEGQVTEIEYFQGIQENKKELGIPAIIEVEPIKRPDEQASWSNIVKIIEFIDQKEEEAKNNGVEFLRDIDKLWIVFDKDQIQKQQYDMALEYAKIKNYNIGFTNPFFDIFHIA